MRELRGRGSRSVEVLRVGHRDDPSQYSLRFGRVQRQKLECRECSLRGCGGEAIAPPTGYSPEKAFKHIIMCTCVRVWCAALTYMYKSDVDHFYIVEVCMHS